jgi:Ca2+-binding RTX toxin-like protein
MMLVLALPSIAQALPSSVKSPLIKFERDPVSSPPNGFASADSSVTHFTDSLGDGLRLFDFEGNQSIGRGLGVDGDDTSKLIINFDMLIKKLSMVFGNDPAGDAVLEVFRGGLLVDSNSVAMNGDDVANQTVAVKGTTFKRAEFYYASGGVPLDWTEIVDTIRVSPVCKIKGTNGKDRPLNGNAKSNSICSFEGNDRIDARGKNDFAHGGGGTGRVKGGPGNDTLLGGSGRDVIRAQDGVEGNDTVYGGGGHDVCFVDAGDNYRGCEEVAVAV